MRPSTRTSSCAGGARFRRGSPFLAFLLVLTSVAAARALPIVAEGRVRPEGENLAVAQRSAVALALADSVRTAVVRHVPASVLEARARDLRGAFFSRPSPYVQRYAINSEGMEGDEFVVTLEADVAEEKVLAELRAMGLPVRRLAARPRVLVAALGEDASTVVGQTVRRTLEAQGFVARGFPGDATSPTDAEVAAAWGRDLGCHVVFAVTAERVEEAPARESVAGPDGEAPSAPEVPAAVRATGWAVDTRTGQLLGEGEGIGKAWGDDPGAVVAVAASRAGGHLANELLAALEQSEWSPGSGNRLVDLEVGGLPGPAEVEALQRAIPSLTEVRSAELRTLSFHAAAWRVLAADTGLGWDAVVNALSLPTGRITWVGNEPSVGGEPEVVRAQWAGP